ncbi:MAG TPA: hypothetical protein VMZ90_15060 [Vicinamibacterales bacterium]|nr:hypothetical protein [Vicinamibacterales bacterium]
MTGPGPDVSVILVTDTFETIAGVLRCYGAGIDRTRLEVVVATTTPGDLEDRIRTDGFEHVRVVNAGDGTLAAAEARALEATRGRYVIFGQHHAFPQPGFVHAMLAACASGNWTAVGATVMNANPATSWSRAAMWINYGRWTAPAHGVMSDVPGHNTAYRRDSLLELGPEIDRLLEAGWPLQLALGARGGRFYLESAASVEMTNPETARTFVATLWRTGRGIAFRRRLHWSLARRIAYGLGAPLIWLIRLVRTCGPGRNNPNSDHRSLALIPFVALGLAASALGEAAGYLVGGGIPRRFVRLTRLDRLTRVDEVRTG